MFSKRTRLLVLSFVVLLLVATIQQSSRSLALSAATLKGSVFQLTVLTSDPHSVQPGRIIAYDIRVKNVSATRKSAASIVVIPPSGFVYQGVTGWGNTCWNLLNGMFFCNAVIVNGGTEKGLTLRYRIPENFSCSSPTVALQVSVGGAGRLSHVDQLVCARCGDGIVQSGEQCDDGNQVDADSCSLSCVAARCGDGKVQSSEQCDDGNTIETDACSTACVPARCGDRVVQTGEQCDDGNAVTGDGCSDRCFIETDLSVLPSNLFRTDRSGFGILTFAIFNNRDTAAQNVVFRASGFGTDDFTFTAPEGCQGGGRSISCIIEELRGRDRRIFKVPVQLSARYGCNQRGPSFFMSVLQSNVEVNPRDNIQQAQIIRDCTFRPSSSTSSVSSASSFSSSSDVSSVFSWSSVSSAFSSEEQSSSLVSSSSVSSDSSVSSVASVSSAQSSFHAAASSSESSAAASVSSTVSSSAVSSSSSAAVCRNGIVEAGEECDDRNSINDDACTNDCRLARCGDGIRRWPNEQCDDGNSDNYDQCPNDCNDPRCGDGVREGLEQCDDGQQNGKKESDCTYQCALIAVPALCGDGVVQDLLFLMRNEACDDGNIVSGDGCRRNCQREHPELCGNARVDVTEQCDDGNTTEWDGCTNCVRDSMADILSSVPKKIVTGQTAKLTIEGLNLQPRSDSVVIMIDLKNLTYVAEVSDTRCKLLGKNSVVCTAQNVASGQKLTVTVGVTSPVVGTYELVASVRSTQRGQRGSRTLYRYITVERPGCGNNIVEPGEQCDWGPMSNTYCTAQCKLATAAALCGNGRIEGKEQCDDGNVWNIDGCDNACMKEFFCRTIDLDPRNLATKIYDVQSNATSYRGTCWYSNGDPPVTTDLYTRYNAYIGCRQYCSRFGANKYNAAAQTWMVQQPDNCKRLYLMYKSSSGPYTPAKYNPTPAETAALGTFFNDTSGNPGCGYYTTYLQGRTPWSYSKSYNPDGYTWGGIVHFCACDN